MLLIRPGVRRQHLRPATVPRRQYNRHYFPIGRPLGALINCAPTRGCSGERKADNTNVNDLRAACLTTFPYRRVRSKKRRRISTTASEKRELSFCAIAVNNPFLYEGRRFVRTTRSTVIDIKRFRRRSVRSGLIDR